MTPEAIQEYRQRLVEQAKANLTRQGDRSFNEERLIDELANVITFDADRERLKKAKRLLDATKRPGSTKCDPRQLRLPGFNEPYNYEPNRMVSDDEGNIIEAHLALPRFKAAQTARAGENVEKAVYQWRIDSAENNFFQSWSLQEALKGRQALDLTWGNCIAENKLLD